MSEWKKARGDWLAYPVGAMARTVSKGEYWKRVPSGWRFRVGHVRQVPGTCTEVRVPELRVCARDGCSETFFERTYGNNEQKYCHPKCKHTEWLKHQGKKGNERGDAKRFSKGDSAYELFAFAGGTEEGSRLYLDRVKANTERSHKDKRAKCEVYL